jgi:hypothetical protein
MNKLFTMLPLAASIALFGTASMAASPSSADKGQSTAGDATSNRTPTKKTMLPESQVDTTKNGKTSDRTPSNHGGSGAAAGEQGKEMSGVSSSQEQAYEETYKTDKAQEEQLKSGGKAR